MKLYKLPDPRRFDENINGKKSHLIILRNHRGMEVALSDYGARIVSIIVPDKNGNSTDVVLGFDHIDGYLQSSEPYYGVSVGRFANRIACGRFVIDGTTYQIPPNNGVNALHGGDAGFHTKVWDRRIYSDSKVDFFLVSPDGEGGFPGNLTVTVSYILTETNELIMRYLAKTDTPTVINLTNHAFFNLNGEGAGTVYHHRLQLHAPTYLPVDDTQIPIGERRAVAHTAFDFTQEKAIGQDIAADDAQIRHAKGYDHTFIVGRNDNGQTPVASVYTPRTGICLQVFSTEPGVQLYTGNFLTGKDMGKRGRPYGAHEAFCLETQNFPDAPNRPDFPDCVLRPHQLYRSETQYRFRVKK